MWEIDSVEAQRSRYRDSVLLSSILIRYCLSELSYELMTVIRGAAILNDR